MSQIYLISPPEINLLDFQKKLAATLSTEKVAAFQLRLKNIPAQEILTAAKTLLPICHNYGVPFILNDHTEIARDIAIDGVHVGKDDLAIKDIRKEFDKDFIIGASCYNSQELAIKAVEDGANYVSFGAFFPTATKKNTVTASIDILNWWRSVTNIPCSAIGGINQSNIKQISTAQPDFICMISAIWNSDNPKKMVEECFVKI